MTRCYVCNADSGDPCGAIDGEIAECPRPRRQVVRATMAAHDDDRPFCRLPRGSRLDDPLPPAGPMPDDMTPNEVFGVGGRCRRNSGGHKFELDWHGSTYDLKCRWCGKRESP